MRSAEHFDIKFTFREVSAWCGLVLLKMMMDGMGVIVTKFFLVDHHPFLALLKHLMDTRWGLVLASGPCATIEARNMVQGKWAHALFKSEADLKDIS